MAAGVVQVKTQIYIWDICTRTRLKQINLPNSVMVQCIKFAYDKRHIAVTTLSNEFTQMLIILDTETEEIKSVSNFTYSLPYRI